ncbi:MAG: hypothetical protein Q7S40_15210 [Opitutaceae bacterium]|nr:hypothetical protein [Opitutaceae bacterium]
MARAGAFLFASVMSVLVTSAAGADRAADIAEIHLAAMGGATHVRALGALRIKGSVITTGGQTPFTLLAVRPNRVRMETQMGGRILIRASDGVAPPWKLDPATSPAAAAMPPAAAELFLFDADFDDPLVAWQDRGYRLELGTGKDVRGRRLLQVLVVRSLTQNITVLLDPLTYLIAYRVQQLTAGPQPVELVSRYDDYRPVAGVLVPHEVTLFVDGELSQRATFDTVEANPPLPKDTFSLSRS